MDGLISDKSDWSLLRPYCDTKGPEWSGIKTLWVSIVSCVMVWWSLSVWRVMVQFYRLRVLLLSQRFSALRKWGRLSRALRVRACHEIVSTSCWHLEVTWRWTALSTDGKNSRETDLFKKERKFADLSMQTLLKLVLAFITWIFQIYRKTMNNKT